MGWTLGAWHRAWCLLSLGTHISTLILWGLGKILNLSKLQFLHLENGNNGVICEAGPHPYTHSLISHSLSPTLAFFPGSYLTYSDHSLNVPGYCLSLFQDALSPGYQRWALSGLGHQCLALTPVSSV